MKKLKILMLEDNKFDAKLIKEELTEHKFDFISELVETKKDFINAIHDFQPDIILSDYNLPQFTGFEALEIAKKLIPEIPFIIVTGSLSEETAVESIKKGAWDYVIKENLLRMTPAIENALKLKVEKIKNRQAEEQIRKLSTAVKQSPSIIAITDIKGNLEYVNPKFTEITGYTLEEAKGINPRILKSGELTDDIYKEMWKLISSGKEWRGEFLNKNKSGELFWEASSISPIFDEQDKIINYIKVAEDITQRKQAEEELRESEEKLRLMIDNSLIGFSATDLRGNFIEVNPAVCDMIGYSSNEIIHKHFNQFSHPDDRKKNKELNKKLLENQIPHFDLEKRYIHKNGNIVNVLIRSQIVRDDKGKPLFEMAITEDITKRKLAEEKLKKRMRELEIFNESTVNREFMINELRAEINELLIKLGEKIKYKIVE